MTEEPSERLIEQRVRNRIFEILEILADCEAGADLVGIRGYFELFEDFLHRPSIEAGKSALSKDERMIVLEIADVLEAAGEASADFTRVEFIEGGWPERIAMRISSNTSRRPGMLPPRGIWICRMPSRS